VRHHERAAASAGAHLLHLACGQGGTGAPGPPCSPRPGSPGTAACETPVDEPGGARGGKAAGHPDWTEQSSGDGGEGWGDESGLTPLSCSSFGPSRSGSGLSPASTAWSPAPASVAAPRLLPAAQARPLPPPVDTRDLVAGDAGRAGDASAGMAERGAGKASAGGAGADGRGGGVDVQRLWGGAADGAGAGGVLAAAGNGVVWGGAEGAVRVWAWVDGPGRAGEEGRWGFDAAGPGGGGRGDTACPPACSPHAHGRARAVGGGALTDADGGEGARLPPLSPGDEDGSWCGAGPAVAGEAGATAGRDGTGDGVEDWTGGTSNDTMVTWRTGPAISIGVSDGEAPTAPARFRAEPSRATGRDAGQERGGPATSGGCGHMTGQATVSGRGGSPEPERDGGGAGDSWELSPGPGRAGPGERGRWMCAHVVQAGGPCDAAGAARDQQRNGSRDAGRAGRAGVVCMAVGRTGYGGYLLACGLDTCAVS
jgi:hypothetical protein